MCCCKIAKSAMQQTYKSAWNAHIALSTKLHLHNTCILPIVLYASECWAPTKANVARLDTFDQWCLRRLLWITWQDHITNIEVRERTGLPAVSETISQRRLSMLGHVLRMPPSADAYKAIYQDIPSDWRRRPGRPQQSWLATIHGDLQKLDNGLDNVPKFAADRGGWFMALHTTLVHATDDDECVLLMLWKPIGWRLKRNGNVVYCGVLSGISARTARVLVLMVLPGQLIFIFVIYVIEPRSESVEITPLFAVVYITAATIQVIVIHLY